MKTILSIWVLLATATSVLAQTKNTATIKQIDAYARSIDKITDRRKEPDIVIADVSDYDTDKPEWRKFKSTKELEAFRGETETYTIAYNWRTNSKIVLAVFTIFSPSGDWVQYVTHYFRPDGSAAKVSNELRTFYGHYIVIREVHLNSKGKVLKKSTKYLDLPSGKPKKPSQDLFGDNPILARNEYYKKVSALPFFSLARKKI